MPPLGHSPPDRACVMRLQDLAVMFVNPRVVRLQQQWDAQEGYAEQEDEMPYVSPDFMQLLGDIVTTRPVILQIYGASSSLSRNYARAPPTSAGTGVSLEAVASRQRLVQPDPGRGLCTMHAGTSDAGCWPAAAPRTLEALERLQRRPKAAASVAVATHSIEQPAADQCRLGVCPKWPAGPAPGACFQNCKYDAG
jgi:hypothetical protein